jgi:hypothetical protein
MVISLLAVIAALGTISAAYPDYDHATLIAGVASASACADYSRAENNSARDCDQLTRHTTAIPMSGKNGAPSPHRFNPFQRTTDRSTTSRLPEPSRSEDRYAGIATAKGCSAASDKGAMRCEPTGPKAQSISGSQFDREQQMSIPGQRIAGRILNAQGLGIEGVAVVATSIRLFDEEPTDGNDIVRLETETDSMGVYALEDLRSGDYMIQTSRHGAYHSVWASVRTGVQNADLVLVEEETIQVHGQVLSDDGFPIEGVTVLPAVIGVASVSTDRDGRYRLPVALKPAADSFGLRFQSPGYLEGQVTVQRATLDPNDPASVDVTLRPVENWTVVIGTVSSAGGSRLAGRIVQLRPTGQRHTYTAVTDSKGNFIFDSVEGGIDYRLQVGGGSGHEDYQAQVHVSWQQAEFDITLKPYGFGEVTGQLVNLDGSPVPDFHLALRNTASGKPHALVSSDLQGGFVIPQAPAGELVFTSQSTPSMLVRGIRLDPDEELHVPLVVDWGEHEIRGLILDRRGNPVPASRIILKWSHQEAGISSVATRRTAADAQGNFMFSQLGPGPHTLEITAPGHRLVTVGHDASRQGYELTVRLN